MQKTVLRFGLYSFLLITILGSVNLYFMSKVPNYSQQEIIGYITIFLSLTFVFFGIRHYRDKANGGVISYPKALWLGILITLFPSFAFGFFDVIYTHYIDPGFVDKYAALMTQKMQNLPPDQLAAKKKEMEMYKAIMQNPLTNFGLMFCTVLPIGIVISAISALILYRKPKTQQA